MMPFQTPPPVCDYMIGLCFGWAGRPKWLEPTAGEGNMVAAIKRQYPDADITAPSDFFDLLPSLLTGEIEYPRFDIIVANPPFTPIIHGWKFLKYFMEMSDFIVVLLPWFILLNSQKRLKAIMDFGLISITYLPRETFPNSRVQCCVLKMRKGYKGITIFLTFNF